MGTVSNEKLRAYSGKAGPWRFGKYRETATVKALEAMSEAHQPWPMNLRLSSRQRAWLDGCTTVFPLSSLRDTSRRVLITVSRFTDRLVPECYAVQVSQAV